MGGSRGYRRVGAPLVPMLPRNILNVELGLLALIAVASLIVGSIALARTNISSSSVTEATILVLSYQANLSSSTSWKDDGGEDAALNITSNDFFIEENTWYDFSGSSVYADQGVLTAQQSGGGLSYGSGKITVHQEGDYLVEISATSRKVSGSGEEYDIFWGLGVNANDPVKSQASIGSQVNDTIWYTGTSLRLFPSLQTNDTLTLYSKQISDGTDNTTDVRVASITVLVRGVY